MTHENIEGALQGNDTRLNVHSKTKRARWRVIASRDDTPVWPRGATLNATPLLPRLYYDTHAHTTTVSSMHGSNRSLPDIRLFEPSHHQHTHLQTPAHQGYWVGCLPGVHLPKSNWYLYKVSKNLSNHSKNDLFAKV